MKDKFNTIITDDDPVAVFLHSTVIRKSGLAPSPVTFSNAMDTLHYLEDTAETGVMQLIFLDINMPGMSGWDLLDQIVEKKFAHVFVALVSSSVNSEDHRKSISYDRVVGYLEKPLSEIGVQQILSSGRLKSSGMDQF